MRALIVLPLMMLAACQANTPLPPRTVTVCPSLVPYDAGMQKQAAAELRAARPAYPVLGRFVDDYGRLRAQVRACKKMAR